MNGIEFLLDTNVVIGILKASPAINTLLITEQIECDKCAISQITRMELLSYPNLQNQEEQMIQDFLANFSILKFDECIEQETISFRRLYNVKLPDAIIAATAIIYGLQLLTLDQSLQAKFSDYLKKQ